MIISFSFSHFIVITTIINFTNISIIFQFYHFFIIHFIIKRFNLKNYYHFIKKKIIIDTLTVVIYYFKELIINF